MLHLVSGISFLCLLVNLILVPVALFPTHLFLRPLLLSLLNSDSLLCSSTTPSLFRTLPV